MKGQCITANVGVSTKVEFTQAQCAIEDSKTSNASDSKTVRKRGTKHHARRCGAVARDRFSIVGNHDSRQNVQTALKATHIDFSVWLSCRFPTQASDRPTLANQLTNRSMNSSTGKPFAAHTHTHTQSLAAAIPSSHRPSQSRQTPPLHQHQANRANDSIFF